MISSIKDHQISKTISFSLKNINLKIKKSSLTFILGKSGSGKSSLLYSLFGEMSWNSDDKNNKKPNIIMTKKVSF